MLSLFNNAVSVAGARCGKVVRFMPPIVAASPSTRHNVTIPAADKR
jgi:hypothetical protein